MSDPVIATALLDRLLLHATEVNIMGSTYRLEERFKVGVHATLTTD